MYGLSELEEASKSLSTDQEFQREKVRERAQARSGGKGKNKDDGLTPEQRRERYGAILDNLQGRTDSLVKIKGYVVDSGGVLNIDPKESLRTDKPEQELAAHAELMK